MNRLNDKVAIITGGNSGVGAATAIKFAAEGANIAFTDLVIDENGQATEAEIAALGVKVKGYASNAADFAQTEEVVNQIKADFGSIDILVNNAGIAWLDTFMNTDDKLRDAHFDINIKGSWNMAKAVCPIMMEKKAGAVVNLSSVTGPLVADPGEVAYATTKAALMGFTKGLAAEMVSYGIRVNAIQPGYIMTPMVEGIAEASNASDPESVIKGSGSGADSAPGAPYAPAGHGSGIGCYCKAKGRSTVQTQCSCRFLFLRIKKY